MKVNTHSGGKIQENAYVVSANIWHCQIERAVAVKIASSEEQRPDADPIILRRGETAVANTQKDRDIVTLVIAHSQIKDAILVKAATCQSVRAVTC